MQKHIKFSLCRGRGALVGLSIIFHMFSAFHQNEFKAFLSILDTYIFFLIFGLLSWEEEEEEEEEGQPTYGKFHKFFSFTFWKLPLFTNYFAWVPVKWFIDYIHTYIHMYKTLDMKKWISQIISIKVQLLHYKLKKRVVVSFKILCQTLLFILFIY